MRFEINKTEAFAFVGLLIDDGFHGLDFATTRERRTTVRGRTRPLIFLPFDERGKILIGILGWQILYVQIGFAKILLS